MEVQYGFALLDIEDVVRFGPYPLMVVRYAVRNGGQYRTPAYV